MALLIRVRADGNAADSNTAEEQACRVEQGHFAGEAPHHTDASVVAERCDQLVEKRTADAVNGQVDFPLAQKLPQSFPPFRVRGIEHKRRALRLERRVFLRAA